MGFDCSDTSQNALGRLRSAEKATKLAQTWALSQQSLQFELGHVLNCAATDAITPIHVGALGLHHAGLWECLISDCSLIWSGGVYDLFGLERGHAVTRDQAIAHYTEDSRVKLERLRSYAIKHKLGFTVDVQIRAAAVGEIRQMRVIAAPYEDENGEMRLQGLKLAI
jgi:hypothetical protein